MAFRFTKKKRLDFGDSPVYQAAVAAAHSRKQINARLANLEPAIGSGNHRLRQSGVRLHRQDSLTGSGSAPTHPSVGGGGFKPGSGPGAPGGRAPFEPPLLP